MDNLKENSGEPYKELPPTPSLYKSKKFIFGGLVLLLMIAGLIFGLLYLKKNTNNNQGLNDTSLSDIKKSGKLIVGSSPPYGPMEFFDKSGNIIGIDIDIAKEIALSLGVDLEIKEIDFDKFRDLIISKDVDLVISSITITPERSSEVLFSIPYFSGGQTLIAHNDKKDIKSLSNLDGKTIGVEDDGTSLNNAISNFVKNPLIKTYKDSAEIPYVVNVTKELKNNKIDAFVVDYIAGIDIIKNDLNLKMVGDPFTQEYYGIATSLNNKTLMEEINNVLREMKRDGRLKTIENKWVK